MGVGLDRPGWAGPGWEAAPPGAWGQAWAAGAPRVGSCEVPGEEELCSQASFLSLLCLPCSSVLPNGFEMKATARMEDAVSMATVLSTARQLQSRALREEADALSSHRAASHLPARGLAEQVAGAGCLVLPTLVPAPRGAGKER